MSQVTQIAPSRYQLDPIELPDDGAVLIETTGVELLETPIVSSPSASREFANDNAANGLRSFAATLPRVG